MRYLFAGSNKNKSAKTEIDNIRNIFGIQDDYFGAFAGSIIGSVLSFGICSSITYFSNGYYDLILLIIPITIGEFVRLGARTGNKNIRYIPLVFSFITLIITNFVSMTMMSFNDDELTFYIFRNALTLNRFFHYYNPISLYKIFELIAYFAISFIAFYICRIVELKEFE